MTEALLLVMLLTAVFAYLVYGVAFLGLVTAAMSAVLGYEPVRDGEAPGAYGSTSREPTGRARPARTSSSPRSTTSGLARARASCSSEPMSPRSARRSEPRSGGHLVPAAAA